MDTEKVRIPVDSIKPNSVCKSDICNDQGILLLGQGEKITEIFRDQLIERGVETIEVSKEDAAALQGTKVAKTARSSKPTSAKRLPHERRVDRSNESYSSERAEQIAQQIVSSITAIAGLRNRLHSVSDDEMGRLCELPQGFLSLLLDDGDQTIAGIHQAEHEDKLAARCTRLAILAVYTAIEMELTFEEIVVAGCAGLLHDISLFTAKPEFRRSDAALSEDDKWEFQQHPLHSRNILCRYPTLSIEIGILVSQVHERVDGSGYPRGLKAVHTHPLAAILSVADTYLSLIDAGPGRPPLCPHDALRVLLQEVARGRLDAPAMRALMNLLTLYPIGSRVLLNNEKQATVLRRDGKHYNHPIVQVEGDQGITKTVDSEIKIVKAVPATYLREMVLPADMIPEITVESLIG